MEKDKKSEKVFELASRLRWQVGDNYHDKLTEGIYANAATISKRAQILKNGSGNRTFDRSLDRILTSRELGFPIMFLVLSIILWLTIQGANSPSGLLSVLFLEQIHPLLKSASASTRW